ncbi:MAG: Sua5/YciO/YrdC/YwlC family protein [Chromatiales bacterium]|jgi:L-threonylcarbamoyladenylate synthase|nr:Sua5/YciO/YrdC/YwlC family protein [Chromatiales bacterium]
MAWQRWRLAQARRYIESGSIVAYPTEAVYGLGCNPFDREAVLRLLRIKQRPLALGLILIGARFEHVAPFIDQDIDTGIDQQTLTRIKRDWPGPRTWLLPASTLVPPWIRGAHATVALRVSAHPHAAALCEEVGGALVSTSANIHGRPAARSAQQLRLRLGAEIDFILPGSVGALTRPTPIRDAVSGEVIRPA